MENAPLLAPGAGPRGTPAPTIGWHLPAGHQGHATEPTPPPDWQRYTSAVLRHKWLVLGLTLAGTAGGAVWARFLEPEYAATSVLWVEAAAHGPNRNGLTDGMLGPEAWAELVESQAVLGHVVRELRLYLQPQSAADAAALRGFQLAERGLAGRYRFTVDNEGQYRLAVDDGGVLERGRVGDSVGTTLGFVWTPEVHELPSDREVEFTLASPYQTARALATSLNVRVDPEGTFLRIEVRNSDAARASATANAIADRVVSVASDLKRRRLEELATILGGQYDHAQRALQVAESALTGFRTRIATRLPEQAPVATFDLANGDDPAVAQAFDLHLTLEQVRHDRRTLAAIIESIPRTGLRVEALAAITAVRESPQLSRVLEEITVKQAEQRALRSRYTDESAPIQTLQADLAALEQGTVPRLAREALAELAAREAVLAPRVGSVYGYLRELPALALEEARLERDVSGADDLFRDIRTRYESARLELVSSLPNLRTLDRAVTPQRPIIHLGPVALGLSFVTSLGLAVLGVTMFDRFDSKVRYPEQVTGEMQLPILGAIPTWRPTGRNAADEVELIEGLRGLRLRILSAHGVEGPLSLTISSPASGDGKSFIAVNLALSFAYAGYRTLLIDGDVRGGTQHRVLHAARRPGLTDVLAGEATLDAAVHETEFASLSLLSSGTRLHRAPELLLLQDLRNVVRRLGAEFSIIIVDSPPLSAGVDPLALASVTGNLLLVLRPGATDLRLAVSKLDSMNAFPVRTMGVVLNDVRGTDAFRYYTYDLATYPLADEQIATSGGWPGILGGRS